uniref:Parathyroid hormone n=1 Tax=Pundamilia nyererei TaxID=303518 RepID=A0A3B4FNE0_9CICH
MFSLRFLEMLVLVILLWSIHTEAKPLRTVSEVQLMHNVREHKQVGERQDWLQEKLKGIIVASSKPLHGKARTIKNLFQYDVFGSKI